MVSIFLFISEASLSKNPLCLCQWSMWGAGQSSGFVPARPCLDGNSKKQCWAWLFYLIFISGVRDHFLCSHKCKVMYLKRLNEENVKLNKNVISFTCLEKTQLWIYCCYYEMVIKCTWCLSIL